MMVLDIESLKDARITLTLIFVNILNFLLLNLTAPEEVTLFLVQINRNIIYEYEVWRLITSIFLHGDPIHLFSNMFALLLFGATVENNKSISKIQFLIIYFVSGLIGNLFSLFLLPLDVISLGASGAIFGLIGVAFTIIATDDRSLLFFALFYLAFFIATSFMPGINFWAHIFGLLGGILLGYLFYIRKRKIKLVY
ncbi:MAG: rhomboid family intramembrane serine protease [Candidatus Lokiarchaeota archaeon]|nr:rhomboid family intramembrane serine protease [Candidatus Lokiarchaeota archaeon]